MDEMDVLNRAEELVEALAEYVRGDPRLCRLAPLRGMVERLHALLTTHAEPKT